MAEKMKHAARTPAAADALYSVDEFAGSAAKIFGKEVRSECVVAAFRVAGRTKAGVEEAKKLVYSFLKKEVK